MGLEENKRSSMELISVALFRLKKKEEEREYGGKCPSLRRVSNHLF
jgi:hypothetical protein